MGSKAHCNHSANPDPPNNLLSDSAICRSSGPLVVKTMQAAVETGPKRDPDPTIAPGPARTTQAGRVKRSSLAPFRRR